MRPTLAALLFASAAAAQDFRVYTTIRETGSDAVLSRSQTLFHAGRSYDHIEAVGEVVIGDPAHRRFTILRGGHVGTRVSFDEVNQFRRAGERETRAYAKQLVEAGEDPAVAAALVFQLDPKFAAAAEPGRVALTADSWRYAVATAEPPSPGLTAAYLDYADRAAGLNYVLHPQSFHPAPREALNERLRDAGRLPTRVELEVAVGRPVRLTAEHRFEWALHPYDRSQIQNWTRLAESDAVEWVSFREFQSRAVAAR